MQDRWRQTQPFSYTVFLTCVLALGVHLHLCNNYESLRIWHKLGLEWEGRNITVVVSEDIVPVLVPCLNARNNRRGPSIAWGKTVVRACCSSARRSTALANPAPLYGSPLNPRPWQMSCSHLQSLSLAALCSWPSYQLLHFLSSQSTTTVLPSDSCLSCHTCKYSFKSNVVSVWHSIAKMIDGAEDRNSVNLIMLTCYTYAVY